MPVVWRQMHVAISVLPMYLYFLLWLDETRPGVNSDYAVHCIHFLCDLLHCLVGRLGDVTLHFSAMLNCARCATNSSTSKENHQMHSRRGLPFALQSALGSVSCELHRSLFCLHVGKNTLIPKINQQEGKKIQSVRMHVLYRGHETVDP